nr:hypothetical protein BaRGS_004020 [Batillaria attramentaria]
MASDTELASVQQALSMEKPVPVCDVEMTDDMSCDASDDVPEDFTDPKSIVAPGSLKELIQQLHRVFQQDDVNIDYVKTLMESYKSNPREWKKFAKFDAHRYTRNLVDEGNGKFNLMVLCWNEAQGSSIHSHAGSHCFLKVLSGTVKEEMYEWPDNTMTSQGEEGRTGGEVEIEEGHEMAPREELTFHTDQCTYICDDLGLHRVENPSHVDKAVTLHLYSPPFDQCYCFDQRTGRKIPSKVTFWSKFGKRTPFGKNPELAGTGERENN